MAEVQYEVAFTGNVTIKFDTNDYPHYFDPANGNRGGLDGLAEDIFYDYADLHGGPFVSGSSEFTDAGVARFESVAPNA